MPAQSEKQVYAFEGNFELATRAVLQAAGYNETLIQGMNVSLPPTRIEVIFALGEALNEAVLLNEDKIYDYFNARLVLRICTERTMDKPSLIDGVLNLHEEWAAGVRTALQERKKPFNETNLPYYHVNTIRPTGSQRDFDVRFLEDYTRLEYLIEFGIRSDAWPL